jgi:16S rRNA (guanine527-N7)-methyltransferase
VVFHVKRRPSAELDAALDRYVALVRRYHATLDLMSDAGLARLDRYVADALRYVDAVASLEPEPRRLLDVGSGVGLPGIVVAAALPDVAIELVERRRKRATFLRMAAAAVGRVDVVVRDADVRATQGEPADVVTAQAVARLAEVYRLVRHRCADPVVLVARKGPEWSEEVEELAAQAAQAEAASITDVLLQEPLEGSGTLVAVRVRGGRPCRSSA